MKLSDEQVGLNNFPCKNVSVSGRYLLLINESIT